MLLLFFASGVAALVYQVLWVRELGLLFGSTARAAAITISVFFSGLAAGGWFWGRRAARLGSALRWFGILELLVAASAIGYFVLVDIYFAAYPALYGVVGGNTLLDTLLKAAVAFSILFPPAFFMGGTLPLMSHHLVSRHGRLGATGALTYATNTAGSACGALIGGMLLPPLIGFQLAYLTAVTVDALVGVCCMVYSRADAGNRTERASVERPPVACIVHSHTGVGSRTEEAPVERPSPANASGGDRPAEPDGTIWPRRVVWIIAFASGFATLAIEVIWTRLFSQVLQNSAYTYALVLSTFLLALAAGSLLASFLARFRSLHDTVVLTVLLILAAGATALSPWLFFHATDGFGYVGAQTGWSGYIPSVVSLAILVMFVPGVLLGAVLPYLMRLLQRWNGAAGDAIGRLVSADTVGAIVGSLAGGFVLLPLFGSWRSLTMLAAVYPAILAFFAVAVRVPFRWGFGFSAAMLAVALLTVNPHALSRYHFGVRGNETLVEEIEGTHATAAAVDTAAGNRVIRVNNYYTLGSTGALHSERNQSVIPLLLLPPARDVFYLGVGTGITAGAGLSFPIETLVACEILPEVISLSQSHFARWNNGLFSDDRATVHADDGRICLSRSEKTYDLIVSDLFTPWRHGIGNLYTLEHYRIGYERLNDGGMYVQWVPLYQVSELELGMIARTMDEAFPEVRMWRGDHYASRSIVALVGHRNPQPIDIDAIADRASRVLGSEPGAYSQAMVLRHYAGNVTEAGVFADYPVNTDNNPHIEYTAPRTHRDEAAGDAYFLTGNRRELMYQSLRDALPADRDPALSLLNTRQLGYVAAGHAFSRYSYRTGTGRAHAAAPHRDDFRSKSPITEREALTPAHYLERDL